MLAGRSAVILQRLRHQQVLGRHRDDAAINALLGAQPQPGCGQGGIRVHRAARRLVAVIEVEQCIGVRKGRAAAAVRFQQGDEDLRHTSASMLVSPSCQHALPDVWQACLHALKRATALQ